MGSAGHWPAPVGDPPTGTSKAEPSRRLSLFAADALTIPSGESPDGTGQWPVLPKTQFPNTHHASRITHHASRITLEPFNASRFNASRFNASRFTLPARQRGPKSDPNHH